MHEVNIGVETVPTIRSESRRWGRGNPAGERLPSGNGLRNGCRLWARVRKTRCNERRHEKDNWRMGFYLTQNRTSSANYAAPSETLGFSRTARRRGGRRRMCQARPSTRHWVRWLMVGGWLITKNKRRCAMGLTDSILPNYK